MNPEGSDPRKHLFESPQKIVISIWGWEPLTYRHEKLLRFLKSDIRWIFQAAYIINDERDHSPLPGVKNNAYAGNRNNYLDDLGRKWR